ncbi:hypothetical protein Poli38472_005563 [Pythium oligandrum]|uniref:Uncharacterized protein n=1 Tax=Pythium oligandrum TaxID=41045 RepID=A0A8K1CHR5_PYTOL|nr:hypothetical protein Poli38472_005563 [Pythium oligandrum]|eukprot:TMW62945.1 hypothetical protein Poli38472_005563 [Pythium oligandrum]
MAMPPARAHAPNGAAPSAPNALFLIGFGMFLVVSLLPALMSALVRTVVILALLAAVAVMTNPSDHSFALWLSQQENVRMKESPSVKQWFSAVVKTAIAMVTNEQLTWTYYYAIVFSVVYVPTLNRRAFGCFGSWWWADANPTLLSLCKAPWVVRIAKGGVKSGIERYMDYSDDSRPLPRSTSDRLRQRRTGDGPVGGMENAAAAFASTMSDFASTLQSGGSGRSFGTDASTATGISDRQLRAKAMQAKIKKDWRDAAKYFLEAAEVALSLLSRANYRLEAAWCELEDHNAYSKAKREAAGVVEAVCEELASAGYFDEAARALAELALRLKRKFPEQLQSEDVAKDLGSLYLRAKVIAEAGNSTRGVIENTLRAASIYTSATLWKLSEECYDTVGKIQLGEGHGALASDAFANAVLCRIGQLDVTGAEQLFERYQRLLAVQDGVKSMSGLDMLVQRAIEAHENWSVDALDAAIAQYISSRSIEPWQRQCLTNLRNKIQGGDLR